MKTTRSLLIALLTVTSLLVPVASQAKTIFERFAPPLLPIPVPVPVPVPGHIRGGEVWIPTPPIPVWRGDYEGDRHYDHDRRDWHDDRRDWREDRHDWRHDRRDYDRYDHYDHYDRHDRYDHDGHRH